MSALEEHTVAPVEAPVEAPAAAAPVEAEPFTAEIAEPTDAPAVEETAVPETTSAAAPVTEPTVIEAGETSTIPTETAATETAATETAATESANTIESGVLGYKAPGLIKSLKFSKKHFWLGEEPVSHDKLSSYLRGDKAEIAHPTAAWASQTGKGLLFFAKHAEEKSHPAGVLNLSEASDVEKQSPHEFSFKLHGHKHTFKAADDAERDGWYAAIEKAIVDAKVTKEGVVGSEGYKESLAHLGKPAIVAGGAAPAVAASRKSVEAPKVEEPVRTGSSSSSSDEEAAAAKKKNQGRSVSRGKRTSIFGNFLNKKEEHDNKKEIKKEEKEVKKEEKEEAKEAKKEEKEEAKEIKKEEKEEAKEIKQEEKAEKEEAKIEEPIVDAAPAIAPLDAEAVATRAVDAPVEEAAIAPATTSETVPAVEATKEESARPKPSKRTSIFGSFFEKVRSPTHEKKESELAPIVPPKDTIVSAEPPVIPAPVTSTTETTIESPAPAINEPVAAPATEEAAVPKTDAISPRKEKEGGFFGGMINKVRAKSPANVDRSLPKTETAPAVPSKTEEVTPSAAVEEPTVAAPVSTESAPVEEAAVEGASRPAITPKESRRKSYFGGSSNKITSLFRKPSQAVRTNEAKKENVVPAVETPAATEEAVATEAPVEAKAEEAAPISETVPETITVGQEHQDAPVVSAAA